MFDPKKLQEGRERLNPPIRPLVWSDREPLDLELECIYGEIPGDMAGHMFFNSSNGTVNSHLPYRENHPDGSRNQEYGSPIMLGSGYVYRLDFQDPDSGHAWDSPKVKLKGRLLKSPSYYADEALKYGDHQHDPKKKHSFSGFKNLGISRISFWLGMSDQLSTAVTPIRYGSDQHDRYVATTDAGRPYEFDPHTMELRTPIGWLKEYTRGTPGLIHWPFPILQTSAHPAFDPITKELFSVNYSKDSSIHFKKAHTARVLHHHHDKIEKHLEGKVAEWEHIENPEEAVDNLNNYFDTVHKEHKTSGVWVWRILGGIFDLVQKIMKAIMQLFGVADFFSTSDKLIIHRFDGSPKMQSWRVVDTEGNNVAIKQCCHQTTLSEDYFVFIDAAFKITLDLMFNNPFPHNDRIDRFIRKHTTHAQEAFTDIYIVSRKDLDPKKKKVTARKVRLKPEFVHCQLNYLNPDGKLTLYGASNSAACLAEWVRPFDQLLDGTDVSDKTYGIMASNPQDIGRIGKYEIDGDSGDVLSENIMRQTGDVASDDMGATTWGVGLYTYRDIYSGTVPSNEITDMFFQCYGMEYRRVTKFVHNLYVGYPNRKVNVGEIDDLAGDGIPNQLVRMDTEAFTLPDYFQFPKGYEIRSIQFVSRVGSKNNRPAIDGYVVVVMLNEAELNGETNVFRELWIFDAANLKQGPLTVMSHKDLNFGFTLHSVWAPSLKQNSENTYNVPVAKDYNYMINKIWFDRRKVRRFFKRNVFPNFD